MVRGCNWSEGEISRMGFCDAKRFWTQRLTGALRGNHNVLVLRFDEAQLVLHPSLRSFCRVICYGLFASTISLQMCAILVDIEAVCIAFCLSFFTSAA